MKTIADVDKLIENTLPNLPGWCTPDKGKRLARLVLEGAALCPYAAAGPLCVEIGVFGGRGVISFALAVEHLLQRNGRVHGIDPYTASAALEGENSKANDEWWAKIDYPKILADVLKKINELDLHVVTIIASHSENAVGDYADGSIDVLHIDANHSTVTSRRDVASWGPKMRPNGFLVFDDVDWETTKPAQADLLTAGFTLLEDHKTWAIYKAPTHVLHSEV